MAVDAFGRDHVGPEGFDVLRLEEPAPGRHLVLAARDRGDEALALAVRKLAQVERALRILHARAVARRAVALVDLGAAADLLRRGRLAPRRSAQEKNYSGSSANVHTEPPGATLSLSASRFVFQ